jgi:hypothetical protein
MKNEVFGIDRNWFWMTYALLSLFIIMVFKELISLLSLLIVAVVAYVYDKKNYGPPTGKPEPEEGE